MTNYVLLGPAISVRASGQTEADIESDDFFEYFEVLLLLFCRVIENVLSKMFPNMTHFFKQIFINNCLSFSQIESNDNQELSV